MKTREQQCRIWLSLSESLSPKGREKLLSFYGSAEACFSRFSQEARAFIGDKAFDELSLWHLRGLDECLCQMPDSTDAVFLGEEHYPSLLKDISTPPDVLFYQGQLKDRDERAIAIVGSRRETRYGREQAYQIAKALAKEGVTVVSGLAYGIDTAAHQGAIDGGGRTIAVLGSGLKRIYPKDNEALAKKIVSQGGALMTEYPPDAEPLAFHFPVRNRIISGLSAGVFLVEAREKSGTLITVGHALEQGREVFALPGPVDSPGSRVPHRLLREGARLCTCAEDILEDMNWQTKAAAELQISWLNEDERIKHLTNIQKKIYDSLCDEVRSFEELLVMTALPVSELSAQITLMEVEGLLETLPGRKYRLNRS